MVRAAGQGHGRNDAATTDPQPRARLPGPGPRAWGPKPQILGVQAGSGPQAWAGVAWGPGF